MPAPQALMDAGPILQVQLTVLDEQAELLRQEGKPVPSFEGHVMIDTGAKRTAVDIAVAEEVGLPVKGRATLYSVSEQNVIVPVFAGKLTIPSFSDIDVSHGLVGVNLSDHDHNTIALIGRDLLQTAVLVYNGADGAVSLSI